MSDSISLSEMVSRLNKSRSRIMSVIRLFGFPVTGKGMDKRIALSDLKALEEFFHGESKFKADHKLPV